jgi:hypothetical protein
MQQTGPSAAEHGSLPSVAGRGKWGRRAALAATCSFLGVAIAGIEHWLRGRRIPVAKPEVASEWDDLPGPASAHSRGTLQWAQAIGLAADQELSDDAYAFIQVVSTHRRHPELGTGCRRLAELALSNRVPEKDSRLLAAVHGMNALGLQNSMARVRGRITNATEFPETMTLLTRLGIQPKGQ